MSDEWTGDGLYFVVGAPRSGTKIFRDTLGAHPRVTTSDHPLEEIWLRDDTDHEQYRPKQLTEKNVSMIRVAFADKRPADGIYIEKNVRNSLRVPYIHTIFPLARFIHIYRNPRDAVASTIRKWQNPIDWDYYLFSGGARKLSLRDLFYYSAKLGTQWIRRLIAGKKYVDLWGPAYSGIHSDLNRYDIPELCVRQWRACVQSIQRAQKQFPQQLFTVAYEGLMEEPEPRLNALADFMRLSQARPMIEFAKSHYRTDRIDKRCNQDDKEMLQKIEQRTNETYQALEEDF